TTPMIKRDGQWQAANWDEALALVADKFKAIAEEKSKQLIAEAETAEAEVTESEANADEEGESAEAVNTEMAALVSVNATLEEQYLTQKLFRALGSGNVDHRLRQSDFSDQDAAPVMPWLGQSIEQLEKLDAALLIGSNVRKEQPIANLRLRKAVVNNGAKVSFVNSRAYDFNYPVANNIVVAQQNMLAELAAIAAASFQLSGCSAPSNISAAVSNATVNDSHKAIAQQLNEAESATVLLGNAVHMYPELSALRVLAEAIAKETGSVFGYLTDGCNAAGAWLAGAVPHRGAAGATEDVLVGKNVAEIIDSASDEKLAACLLLNVEPDTDAVNANALMATLNDAAFVVSVSSYNSASIKQVADVMLPAASFLESSGTYVNVEGFWQSFKGVVEPKGGSRPAWKILRVLGNLTEANGFDYLSSEDVKAEVRSQCESIELSNVVDSSIAVEVNAVSGIHRSSDVPMYATDSVVRRASSLQSTVDAQSMCVRLNAAEADRLGISSATSVTVKQGDNSMSLDLVIDDTIPDASAWIPSAVEGNDRLGAAFAEVSIEGAGV
ncbi:MAG: NADH-quinone oxidoreductase subunit G, partial [Deltaproteobacteria bacterium]